MYIDDDSIGVFIGGSTLSVFILFITAIIIAGLESLMDLVIPFVIFLLIIEPIIALIFIIVIIKSDYLSTKSQKIAKIIIAILCTAAAIVVTLIFKEIMADCVYDDPGIFDIIIFAITGYFFGGICAISLTGWIMTLIASTDGDAVEMLYVALLYEILPLIVLAGILFGL